MTAGRVGKSLKPASEDHIHSNKKSTVSGFRPSVTKQSKEVYAKVLHATQTQLKIRTMKPLEEAFLAIMSVRLGITFAPPETKSYPTLSVSFPPHVSRDQTSVSYYPSHWAEVEEYSPE
eukprot:scaffold5317_cov160-Amphora_coffeaeformis.AAC.22